MKWTLIGLGAILIVAAAVVGSWAIRYYTAEARGRVGAAEQIESAGSRIAAYNHFFDMCASIQSLESRLISLENELSQSTRPRDISRVQASITGVKAARAEAINQYNADARKDYTIAQFRDSDLPYQLNINTEITSCGVN